MEAIKEVHDALVSAGYSDDDASLLIARLLQEEAKSYVDYLNQFGVDLEDLDNKKGLLS